MEDSEKVALCVLKCIKDRADEATDWEVITCLAEREDISQLQIKRCLDHLMYVEHVIQDDQVYQLTEDGKKKMDMLIAKSDE